MGKGGGRPYRLFWKPFTLSFFEISYTKARTYLNCPWLYKLKFLEEWKAPPGPDASLGLSLHKALEKYHRENAGDLETLWSFLDDVWERPGYSDSVQELDYYDRGRGILETYWKDIAQAWSGKVHAIEKEFFFDLPDRHLTMRGILDRVDRMADGTYALIEYKTHMQPWSEERLATDLQMTIYDQAARRILGVSTLDLYFFFVSQGRWVQVRRSPQDWEEALKTIEEVAQDVQQNRFEPDTSHCRFCEMRKSCVHSVVRE